MPPFALSDKIKKILWASLAFMLGVRVLGNFLVPLTDQTEARYGEIARKMLETGDWITPQHAYGVPFWGKPPLSFWLSALSMKVFGVNEFAARLPSLLLGLGMLGLVWHWVKKVRDSDCALLAVVVLASTAQFFVVGGTVMTDSSLVFCSTLAMVAFWQALHGEGKKAGVLWGWAFFAALGVGLLAKGPLVGVLTFLPIIPWVIMRKNWAQVWRRLPWLGGTLLMLAISVPWYVLAENKTPGFLKYFIIGEHFGRALDSGWKGDKYGFAHSEPLGTIWWFWLSAALPWSVAVLYKAVKNAKQWRAWLPDGDGFMAYLLLWSFGAIVFFSIVHNIIWPYVLPALPAFAVVAVELWRRQAADRPAMRHVLAVAMVVPVAMAAAVALLLAKPPVVAAKLAKLTQKAPAEFYLADRPSPDSGFYFFFTDKYFSHYSAEFYSAGRVRESNDAAQIDALLADGKVDYLAVEPDDMKKLSPQVRERFVEVKDFGFVKMLRKAP